jgi:hypothetical protein
VCAKTRPGGRGPIGAFAIGPLFREFKDVLRFTSFYYGYGLDFNEEESKCDIPDIFFPP